MSNVQFLIEAEHNLLSAVAADLLPAEARLVRAGADLTATQSYVYAAWRAERLDAEWRECSCTSCDGGAEDAECPLYPATLEADRLRDAAREAWLASDEPRDWRVSDDQAQDILLGIAPDDVGSRVEDWLRDGDWDTSDGPLYLVAYAYPIDPATGEECSWPRVGGEVTIEQDEPACAEGEEHDWQTPYSVLGGLEENPGVWGRGAGIVSRRVCAHCGAYEVYESARQDSGSGCYYQATSYEESDDASEAWVAARRRKARTEELMTALDAEYEEDALLAAIDSALDEDEDATEADVRDLLDADADEDE